ncbi:hypothetical protein PS925_04933 [Pseudomonas fluorescens]|uniref:DUF3298 domain-containing protein n=1 Tax=Pseudomonas fluorescens TaxID=294 RepID=A0A5E7VFD5_PSEFL|nr:hypothetical protein [Pseudomonas fluorescens]VVQ21278.1 hypothetical protein PS925_04933 [Pseudomonas fluorescens]
MLKGLMRLALCAAVMFSLISTAHAEDGRRVFTGTLGKTPIVVELNTTQPDEVTGRYFYEKYHRDLPLSGALQDSTLTLTEGNNRYGDDKPLPTLKLKHTADGWQGEWQSPQGKKLSVKLAEAKLPAPTSTTLPFIATLPKSEPYEYLRLQGLKLKPAKTESFMGYNLQWWVEPDSKISLFSVASGYPAQDQLRINQLLLERLWREVISYHACMLQGGENAEQYQSVAPTFLSPDVVSLNINTGYDCGGAHPDVSNSPVNLNVHTGQDIKLQDVLWVGERENTSAETNASNQSDVLAPWLIKQFTTLYPNEMKKPADGDEDSCDYTDENVWSVLNWHFTAKGIYLGPYFPRVQRGCDEPEWSILPYSLVKQHPGAVNLQLPQG